MGLFVSLGIFPLKAQDLGTGKSMMCFAAGCLRQLLPATQSSIKFVALLLCGGILPIGTNGVGKGPLELVFQQLCSVQIGQDRLCIGRPENASVLHATSTDAFDSLKD